MILLDTTALIDLTKNDPGILRILTTLEKDHMFYTTQINMYEVLYGIYAIKLDASLYHKKIEACMGLFQCITVLDMTHQGTLQAARIGGTLSREGKVIEDADCLTAGIAQAHGITTILTRNKDHFSRINGLTVMGY